LDLDNFVRTRLSQTIVVWPVLQTLRSASLFLESTT
jgi:hypothetical protein